MGACALLPVLLGLCCGRLWAATLHHVPALELGDRSMKAGRHLDARVHEFYAKNGYEACQHHSQLGSWLHLHRKVRRRGLAGLLAWRKWFLVCCSSTQAHLCR